MNNKMIGTVVIMLILSVMVAMSMTMATAKTDSSQVTDQATQISTDIQKMQITAGPGKLISAKNIKALPALPVVGNKLKEKDIPIRYAISKDKIDNLKKQPFTAIGKQPKADKDKSVGNLYNKQPVLISGYEGMDNQDNILTNGFVVRPPDPDTAAGPNHIGTVTNSNIRFSTKAGATVLTSSIASWFSNVYIVCPNCLISDPRIEYDAVEGHWIIAVLGIDFTNPTVTGVYLVSASQTSDPTGNWFNYNLDGNLFIDGVPTWPDYPDLGIDYNSGGASGAIYLSSNQFDSSAYNFHTSRLNILPKSALYQGQGFGYWLFYGFTDITGERSFTLRPVKTLSAVQSASGPVEYVVNTRYANGNFISLWKITPAFPPTLPGAVGFSIPIGSYSMPPNAAQPGCSYTLDTIDNRLYQAIFRNGHVYTGFNDAFNFGSGTVSAVRYADIDTNALVASQDVRYGADGYYYWFPAITTDPSNNIVFVFARSSPSEFAGIRYTGKKTTDPTTEPSALLKAGEECITGGRWGDYFGVGNDPITTKRVWIYGEYAKNDGINPTWDWGTFVGQVSH